MTDAGAMSAAIAGLGYAREFVVLGIPDEPLRVSAGPLVMQRQSVHGWPSGTSIDSEDTLKFSELTAIRPLIEKHPLDRAPYDRMMSGKAWFRAVLGAGA
ncbi:MAG: hypothetical protein ACREX4_04925 [Gammaproteobacteria bacterium]